MSASMMQGLLNHAGLQLPDWPEWALTTFISLSCGCLVLLLASRFDTASTGSSAAADVKGKLAPSFRRFQLKYLTSYLIIMLADWLQGTNMYTLYQSYGVSVGTLFLTGFSSSAIFGTFLGLFVDRYGRRLGCLVFCILEIIINVLEHFPKMHLLLVGRVLGGISTSLLFTAFESWMVSEHRKRGFPEAWLASTFSISTVGNGIVAILAGIIAQVAADKLGEIGPFQVAIALTALTFVLLLFWEENYGRASGAIDSSSSAAAGATLSSNSSDSNGAATKAAANGGSSHSDEQQSFKQSIASAWHCITSDTCVLLLGLIQSLFEGAMYTFVFMWVPTLLSIVPDGRLPTGLVFSSFMVCVTIGGALSAAMLRRVSVEAGSCAVFAAAAAAMALPAVTQAFYPVLISFLLLETCIGAFYACAGVMRSRYLPDAQQGAIMNIFRLPLNVLVVVGTRLTDAAAPKVVFTAVSLWFAAAAVLQVKLYRIGHRGQAQEEYTRAKTEASGGTKKEL